MKRIVRKKFAKFSQIPLSVEGVKEIGDQDLKDEMEAIIKGKSQAVNWTAQTRTKLHEEYLRRVKAGKIKEVSKPQTYRTSIGYGQIIKYYK